MSASPSIPLRRVGRFVWVVLATATFSVLWFALVAVTQKAFGTGQTYAWAVGLAAGALLYGVLVGVLVRRR